MKSIRFSGVLILCMASFSLFSQNWKFGVNFDPGLHWASVINNNSELGNAGSRFGFNFDVLAERQFDYRYSFYIGISFMNTGFKFENLSDENINFKTSNILVLPPGQSGKIRAQYLASPFGIKLKTLEYGFLSYYFKAGLFPAVKLKGKISLYDRKYDFSDDLKGITCGIQLGAGGMYSMGDDTFLTGGLSFNYMFVDVMSSGPGGVKALPISLGVSLGFLF